MAVDLPDEILSEILTPALHVSDELFCRTSGTPFATYTESTSVLLVVPKDWLRVSTPLLYNVVVLRSKAQAKALDATLKQNASLGRFIKKLRVEGGFGQHMHGILKTAVNITDVHLSLLLHSSDSSSGLVLGLPLINPKRLILSDDYEHPLGNKHVVPLLNTLEICAKNWTNLATVIFPYEDITHHRASILLTLCDAPRVTTISFPSPPFGPGITTYFDKIAENPSLHTIEIRGEHVHKWAKRNLPLPDGSRLAKVVKLVDTSVPRSNLPLARFKPPICLPANASFRPMASSPQTTTDIIWDRVLFFALNFPFSPTTAMALIQARIPFTYETSPVHIHEDVIPP
ncbi:hypothetical protein B0H16DRAFT_1888316 [Mycena metata]|uniref:Uncharacterized protein n=1 Tax=Mycena metata TaxID=1033252 RepID=A0AAD7N796_9AGAR|nr:hypothetical protein B0H16DRAFT_1888316 [Mycena metata]